MRRKRFKVGVNKMYFPEASRPRGFTSFQYVFDGVLANSRTEAVQLVWAEHGERLLGEMRPDVKRVSLDANFPGKGPGGLMNRHVPITVWETT